MPDFVNPFSGVIPARKLTNSELARAIRLNLAAEEEAVHLYEAHADATDNPLAKNVLLDIAREERVHAGEFQQLLKILLDDEESLLAKGAEEVNELAKECCNSANGKNNESEADQHVPTIGNLR